MTDVVDRLKAIRWEYCNHKDMTVRDVGTLSEAIAEIQDLRRQLADAINRQKHVVDL